MRKLPNPLARLFATRYLLRPEQASGAVPSSGEAYKAALSMAWPAVAEMMFVQLIGIVDTVMVSGLGSYAVAAVGLTTQPRMIFLSVFFALNVGLTAIISRRKGEGDRAGANICLAQTLALTFLFSLLLGAISYLSSEKLMLLAGAEEDTLAPAAQYFRVISLGMPISALSMSLSAAQRGVGNTRVALVINIAANIVNVMANYALIGGNLGFPRLEVKGAGIATVIGTGVGLLVALLSLAPRGRFLSFSAFSRKLADLPTLRAITRIGGSAVAEQVFLRVGFFVFALVVAKLGTFYVAAHHIAMQLLGLTFTIGDGLGAAAAALVGQNLGKKRADLALLYGKINQRLALSASALMFTLIMPLRAVFAGLFTNEPDLIALVSRLLVVMAFIQPFQTSTVTMGGSLRGAGDTKYVAFTMLITVAVMRPLTGWLLVYPLGFGLLGAWFAILLDQAARMTMLYTRFARARWRNIAI
ncbi:MAG: MATE family efflux transporter [Oscillospiraceae bacterium]|jgi:putative MATE family efflux protein|nr:MATE family efflux transporter [Oscillospiraceae bacterium]